MYRHKREREEKKCAGSHLRRVWRRIRASCASWLHRLDKLLTVMQQQQQKNGETHLRDRTLLNSHFVVTTVKRTRVSRAIGRRRGLALGPAP